MKGNYKEAGVNTAGVMLGVIATSYLTKKTQEAVSGLFGEDQETAEKVTKNYVVPGVAMLAGALASTFCDNSFVKSVGYGVATVGGVKMVNEVAGEQIVGLGNPETQALPIQSSAIALPRLPEQTRISVNGAESTDAGMGSIADEGMGIAGIGCL